MARKRRGYRTIKLALTKEEEVSVYTSPRTADALEEVTKNASLYHGVRLAQILEAVYNQGKKDGARAAFEAIDSHLAETKQAIPHANPGRPRKRR